MARKWHKVRKEADRWKDTDLYEKAGAIHLKLVAQQKLTRKLSRQAQAVLEQRTKDRLKEAGLTEQSRAITKDKRGKALRQA